MGAGESPGSEARSRVGSVTIRRSLNDRRNVLLTSGRFDVFLAAYHDHVQRWELETDGLLDAMMRQGLAGVALHVSLRPPDESVGFTFNIRHPSINLFITGDAATQSITGRAMTQGVRVAESSRVFVQSQRPGQEPSTSILEVEGLDLLVMLDRYYRGSEQAPARFFEFEDDTFVGVMSLPGTDAEWLEALRRDEVPELLAGGEFLEERSFTFRCGCNTARMLRVLRDFFGARPEELFAGEAGVETFCPRCGSRWWVERSAFDAEADPPDPSEAPR